MTGGVGPDQGVRLVLALVLLVALAVGVARLAGVRQGRDVVVATARAVAQIAVVGSRCNIAGAR